ncbi:unnamed protein product [Closterium sp. NIES-64]|nr:unnamed protein product [Closterium sp. NIES-64]
MRSVPDRKRPQKVVGSRMDQGASARELSLGETRRSEERRAAAPQHKEDREEQVREGGEEGPWERPETRFVENEGRWRPDSVPDGTAGQGRTVEEVAMTGPPEGSARETATGRASGSRAVRSRKKQREAPESSVKVCSAAVDSEINSAGQLSGLRELNTPSVVETSEAALCGVRSPTLLTSAVTSANDVRAAKATPPTPPPPPPVLRVPLTDLLGRRSVLLALATASASTTTTAAATSSTTPTLAAAASTATPTTASAPATSPAAAATTPTAATSPSSRATTPTAATAPHHRLPRRHRHRPCPLCPCRCGARSKQTQSRPSQHQGGRQQQQRRQREEGGKENTPQRTGYGGRHERNLQRLC